LKNDIKMLETLEEFLTSLPQVQWSQIVYLIIGIVFGALISVTYNIRAQSPRLNITGGGSGGNATKQSWRITISNRPSFFGKRIDGKPARDLHAHLGVVDEKSQRYGVSWGNENNPRVTIDPGKEQFIELFHWQEDLEGYYVFDSGGDPIARFKEREQKFVLTIRDRFEQKTDFRFTVHFNDTHLKNKPSLHISHPISMALRFHIALSGLRKFVAAFRRY
jgi:hypothetical protein